LLGTLAAGYELARATSQLFKALRSDPNRPSTIRPKTAVEALRGRLRGINHENFFVAKNRDSESNDAAFSVASLFARSSLRHFERDA
jgi:hypothetical protein